jgi:TfoX/Sxy family transcriptional regulator of competence genes
MADNLRQRVPPKFGALPTRVSPTSGTAPTSGAVAALRSPLVAYDQELAFRIRELLSGERRVHEKKMFGGLAFLVGGNMAIAASGLGGVLVRVDPAKSDHLVRTTKAEVAIMRERPMPGWLRVAPEHLTTRPQLEKWVRLGVDYAGSLPARK